ncbi:MAG: FecR domain-containing protein [Candidatus Komeilibacteria bacterium]|nr:FecR domain-containing protein [Candidatus Komeilibacteria bacterium]
MPRTKIVISILVALVAIGAGIFLWVRQGRAAIGSLNIYTGSVTVLQGEAGVVVGATGMKVQVGDVLKTGPSSRISVILNDGSVIRLEENSEAEVSVMAYRGNKIGEALFKLHYGNLWSDVQPVAPSGKYQIETPAIVASIRGTNFNVSYVSGVHTVAVAQGTVGVALLSDQGNEKRLTTGSAFAIHDEALQPDFDRGPEGWSDEAASDGWTQFNVQQSGLEPYDTSPAVDETAAATSTEPVATSTAPAANSNANINTLPKNTNTNQQPTSTNTSSNTNQPTPTNSTPTPQPPAKKLISILLLPKQASVKLNGTVQLSATGRYSDNSLVTITGQVSWIQKPDIGTLSKQGLFQGTQGGQTAIQASLDGIFSNEIAITVEGAVQPPVKTITALRVSYAKQPSTGIAYGFPSSQFNAIAYYSDNSNEDVTQQTTWSVVTGTAQGSITGSGSYTPHTQGIDTVRAEFNGLQTDTQIQAP